jgi:predicted CopG family antitoxin
MSTTIAISEENRDKLKSLGSKGETYDDIIERLIEESKDG